MINVLVSIISLPVVHFKIIFSIRLTVVFTPSLPRYNRRSCFWEFTRHLDKLDVLLVSRINQDNLFGMKSFLSRRLAEETLRPNETLHPEITYSFFNHTTMNKDGDAGTSAPSSLSVSLVEEASLGGSLSIFLL